MPRAVANIASVVVEVDVPAEESEEEEESAEELTDDDKGGEISLRFCRDECKSSVKISPSTPVSQLFVLAAKLAGAYVNDVRMEFDGKKIPRNYKGSILEYGIRDGDFLYFDLRC